MGSITHYPHALYPFTRTATVDLDKEITIAGKSMKRIIKIAPMLSRC